MRGHPDFVGSVMVPIGAGWVPLRLKEVARQVTTMDPNLTLEVRCEAGSGRPEYIDLFEKTSDGAEHWVTRWEMHEVERIIPDIMRSDRQAPDHVPLTEPMKRNHEAIRAKNIAEGTDVMLEFADRVEGIKRDMRGEKPFSGQAGFGDSPFERVLDKRSR